MKTILWCTSHYKNTFAKEKAKELRRQGYNVKLGNYIKENGNTYCKIYLVKDFNYHILKLLESIKVNVKVGKKDVVQACKNHKEELKKICKKFEKPCKIEYNPQTKTLFAVTDEKEFSISLN